MKWLPIFSAAASIAALSFGAETVPPGDQQIADYFRSRTAEVSSACLADITSAADVDAHRETYRRQLQEMLGLWPMPARTDLKPVITGRIERDDFAVEKLYFQASPSLYVTANLYLPKHTPAPAILLECGHLRVKTNGVSYGNKIAYQRHGAWFAENGYVCLVVDSLQLGEIEGIHPGTRNLGMWWWNSRGYTPAGVEAWFGIRALDYLSTRPEVDTNHIGITGHSGGGAYSWTITALDDRIKAAAPLAGLTDLQNHIVDGRMDSHCDCNFFPNIYRWDFPQLAALVAPRPLLIGSEDKDRIFPLDGAMRLYAKARRVYDICGATNLLGLTIVEGGHADSPDFEVPVLRWFNRHLKGEDPPITRMSRDCFSPEELRVFDHLPSDAINTNIQALFVPEARPALKDSVAERKQQEQDCLAVLRQKSFAAWPAETEPLAEHDAFSVEQDGLRLRAIDFQSEALVKLRLYVLESSGTKTSGPVILEALDGDSWPRWLAAMEAGFAGKLEQETSVQMLDRLAPDRLRFSELKNQILSRHAILAWIAPRGVGLTAWTPGDRKLTQVRRRFMLLGQTLDGMRVWDIRRAAEALRKTLGDPAAKIELHGSGSMSVNVLYAALFDPGVARLELANLPASHMVGPDYFNVLRIWDIPQALQTASDRMEVTVQRQK